MKSRTTAPKKSAKKAATKKALVAKAPAKKAVAKKAATKKALVAKAPAKKAVAKKTMGRAAGDRTAALEAIGLAEQLLQGRGIEADVALLETKGTPFYALVRVQVQDLPALLG